MTMAPPLLDIHRSPQTDDPSPHTQLVTLLARTGAAVAELPWGDPRWRTVGPQLTATVDAARRAIGEHGSTIGPSDRVTPILRVRDLAAVAPRVLAARNGVRPGAAREVAAHVAALEGMIV